MSTVLFDEFIDPNIPGSFAIRAEYYMRYLFACSFIRKKQIVYDIGCGNGYGLKITAEHLGLYHQQKNQTVLNAVEKPLLYGFDRSIQLLSEAPDIPGTLFFEFDFEKYHFTKFVTAKKLPFPHVITAFEILEHLENPSEVLKQLADLLHDNGTLVLSVPNKQYEPKKKGKPKNKFHKQLFTAEIMEKLLIDAGFRKLTLYGQPRTNALYHKSKLLNGLINAITNRSFSAFSMLARMIAKPTKNTSEKSYSIIIVAKK